MSKNIDCFFIYHFEINSIQRYVFESGRLAEMVGASDLIEHLISEKFNQTISTLGIDRGENDQAVIRQAGAAITIKLHTEAEANRLRDVWGLVVLAVAPGLSFTQSVCTGNTLEEALRNAHENVNRARNQQLINLPTPGPIIARAPRTGAAAVDLQPVKADRVELVDISTKAKRQKEFRQGKALIKRILPEPYQEAEIVFPRNMEPDEKDAFPFSSQNHYVAVVHIDGNGFGQLLMRLASRKNGQADIKRFSGLITEATQNAVQRALESVVLEPWIKARRLNSGVDEHDQTTLLEGTRSIVPFRPLVLGGDDLTVITAAEYAVEFVSEFIKHFEDESKEALKSFHDQKMPDFLTACAGIAFVKSTQPFYLAYELAESLCAFAKTKARENTDNNNLIPSALALHRITSSFIADYDTALREELTAYRRPEPVTDIVDDDYAENNSPASWQLSLGAYGLGQADSNLPRWRDLHAIVTLFEDQELISGPLRNFLTLLHNDPEEAAMAYKRWGENMQDRHEESFEKFQQAVNRLYRSKYSVDFLPFTQPDDGLCKTFLGDLLNVCAAQGEVHGR